MEGLWRDVHEGGARLEPQVELRAKAQAILVQQLGMGRSFIRRIQYFLESHVLYGERQGWEGGM